VRFPYAERAVDPLPGEEGPQVIGEPIILVRFIGPERSYLIRGLIDSGASMTLVPRFYMARLGIPTGASARLGSAGGALSVRMGTLDLELRLGRTCHRWSARVGFVPRADNLALLDHSGFLEYFRVILDGPRRCVSLTPTGTFPPSRIDAE
jgi:hypothetical protein